MLVLFEKNSRREIRGTVVRDDQTPSRRKIIFVAGYRPETASGWRGPLPADGEVWVVRFVRDTQPADPRRGALMVTLERPAAFEWRLFEKPEVLGIVPLEFACFLEGKRVDGGHDDSWLPPRPENLEILYRANRNDLELASRAERELELVKAKAEQARRAIEVESIRLDFEAGVKAFEAGISLEAIAWPTGVSCCVTPEPHLWVAEGAPVCAWKALIGWRSETSQVFEGEYLSPDERGTRGGFERTLGTMYFPPKPSRFPREVHAAAKAVWLALGGTEANRPELSYWRGFGWRFGQVSFSEGNSSGWFCLKNEDGTKFWGPPGEVIEEAIRRAGGIAAVLG